MLPQPIARTRVAARCLHRAAVPSVVRHYCIDAAPSRIYHPTVRTGPTAERRMALRLTPRSLADQVSNRETPNLVSSRLILVAKQAFTRGADG
jgi:hypothetical protein